MSPALLAGAAVIGACFVVLAVLRPRLSLVLLVALDVSNINGVIGDHVGISPYKPQLAIAILVLLVLIRRRAFRFAWSPVMLGLGVLFAGFLASLSVAADPVTAQAVLTERARDLLYFVVVVALTLSTRSVVRVSQSAVVVLAALAALTVVHQFVLHNQGGDLGGLSRVPLVQEGGASTPRHAGTSSDVNFWGRSLILVAPLSLALWAAARSRLGRLWWLGCAAALLLGVFLTQSRGGFIALFLAVVVWFALAGGRYRTSLVFLPVILAVVVPLSGIGSRLGTLSDITSGSTASADPSVVTRKRLQLDAWSMFVDSPLTGHGIGSYGAIFEQYDRLANFYTRVDIVVAAHNFYLEQAADGGIVLLLAWAVFFGTVLFSAARARRIATAIGRADVRLLATGVIASLIGWLVASVFLHLSDFRSLLLIAAIAAVLDLTVRHDDPPPAATTTADDRSAPARRARVRPTPIAVRALALVAAALGAAGLAASLGTGADRYAATVTLGVVPSNVTYDPAVAYQLDVISRGLIVPTLATTLSTTVTPDRVAGDASTSNAPSAVRAVQSRLGGAVVVTVHGADEADTRAWADAATAAARADVAELDIPFTLIGEPGPVVREWPLRRWAAVPCGLLLLVAVAGLVRAGRARRRAGDGDRLSTRLRGPARSGRS